MSPARTVISRHKFKGPDGEERERLNGIDRGMVFWADVLPEETRGSEQYSEKKRPWVVISDASVHSRLAIVIAAPLTSKTAQLSRGYAYRIELQPSDFNLEQGQAHPLSGDAAVVLTEQIRALSHERLGDMVARLTMGAMYRIEAGVKHALKFG